MENIQANLHADVEAISRIPIMSKILEVICRTTGMGFAAIAMVTEDKWIACSVLDEIQFGLEPGSELKLETTICNEIRQSGEAVVIEYADRDEKFFDHFTPAMYGFQSYISVPVIRKDGTFFGTLCAIDPKPALINTPAIIEMFNLFADLISFYLNPVEQLTNINPVEQLTNIESRLLEEQKTAELREQFIAILGHDLLNPVSAVMNAAQLLLRMPLDERGFRLANIIQNSSYRMKGLVDSILDFAHSRMGGGIILNRYVDEHFDDVLNQVITELRVIWPNRVISTEFALNDPVNCDSRRIAQLFSNLLGNALAHGNVDTPVRVQAVSRGGEFKLSVANSGDKIPDAAMGRLFQPFYRGHVKPGQQGLGLGLYIASEIANAHGGTLNVVSTDEETRFTLLMPAK